MDHPQLLALHTEICTVVSTDAAGPNKSWFTSRVNIESIAVVIHADSSELGGRWVYTQRWFQRQQPTSGGTVRSLDLQIVVNTSHQTVSSTVFRTRVSLQRLS